MLSIALTLKGTTLEVPSSMPRTLEAQSPELRPSSLCRCYRRIRTKQMGSLRQPNTASSTIPRYFSICGNSQPSECGATGRMNLFAGHLGNPLATSIIESALQTNEETYSAHSFPAPVLRKLYSINLVILALVNSVKDSRTLRIDRQRPAPYE
jgi:hypothetical protein